MSSSRQESFNRAKIRFTTVRNTDVAAAVEQISNRWRGSDSISRLFTRLSGRGVGKRIVYATECDPNQQSQSGCLLAFVEGQERALSPFQYEVEPCANCPRAARNRAQIGIFDDVRSLVSGG